ncbi:hypothetical protein PPL_05296 [Heterostelium album PN500]|uniref:B30.2/SPRY domain-containing protein n=1 Tax=Heterostelium pallidum (strain ATCC 26659 / Pp 5 / PN500) TaxID=670386 RepID=D3BBA9_HETP5|nr:hypothetical protein PPL_05296 [Heterostelium album PN500]EFA81316.1 hypothetical protein PPL_05296 [Heterostelium album PN500]|eukprot:XP_020433434.1 hypothetical protein PPL_05296 [Heterostelium album PN500]
MIHLISTLNACFVDYDFSSSKPDQFRKESNLSLVMNSVNTSLQSIINNYKTEMQERLWTSIDQEIVLSKTEIYSYIPESPDPFTEEGVIKALEMANSRDQISMSRDSDSDDEYEYNEYDDAIGDNMEMDISYFNASTRSTTTTATTTTTTTNFNNSNGYNFNNNYYNSYNYNYYNIYKLDSLEMHEELRNKNMSNNHRAKLNQHLDNIFIFLIRLDGQMNVKDKISSILLKKCIEEHYLLSHLQHLDEIVGPSAMESLQAQQDFDLTSSSHHQFSEIVPIIYNPTYSSLRYTNENTNPSSSSSSSSSNNNINTTNNNDEDTRMISIEDEDDSKVPNSDRIVAHFLDSAESVIQQQHDYYGKKKMIAVQPLDLIVTDQNFDDIASHSSAASSASNNSNSNNNNCHSPLYLECLPVEILFCICKFLNVNSLRNLSMVNRFFQEMGNQEDIWKHIFIERYGGKCKLPGSVLNWRLFYSAHHLYTGDWDKNKKGKMVISKEGLTVSHGGDYLGSYQSARGSHRIESGCTYWEILIECLNFNQTGFHLVIGVIPESFTVWQSYLTSNGGWGYLADGRKANNSGNGIPYAKGFVQGDRVGVLVDMNEKTLSFYLNGVSQGVAFRNIDQPVYPGVSLLTGGQKKLQSIIFTY